MQIMGKHHELKPRFSDSFVADVNVIKHGICSYIVLLIYKVTT